LIKILKFLNKRFEEILVVIITSIMIIILFSQVIFRYMMNIPIPWAEEMASFLMVYLCYFGASLAVRERRHLKVDIILYYLPKKVRIIWEICIDIIFLVFSSVICVKTYEIFVFLSSSTQIYPATNIKKWIVFAGLPLSFGVICFRIFQDILRYIKENKELRNNYTKD